MPARQSRAAGSFFPHDPDILWQMMQGYVDRTRPFQTAYPDPPVAIIAPHAGYAFSGGIAAQAWATTARISWTRIVILSPTHHHRFQGIALPDTHGAILLPGKRVNIDRISRKVLIRERLATGLDDAFEREHGIDTHLPFAKQFHPKVPILPVVIGQCDPADVARLIDRLSDMNGRTLFVLSTDLSHDLRPAQAVKQDLTTAGLIEAARSTTLTSAAACGVTALAGWHLSQTGSGARVVRLGLSNSVSTVPDANRVVGYGAWSAFAQDARILSDQRQAQCIEVVRRAVLSRLTKGVAPCIDVPSFPAELQGIGACFVSLRENGVLRGCIGSVAPHRPLIQDMVINGIKAAQDDVRFAPLDAASFKRCDIQISIISVPIKVCGTDEETCRKALIPGKTGAQLRFADKRGVLLPSVWDSFDTKSGFLNALKAKAGLSPYRWHPEYEMRVFHAESFGNANARTRSQAA